MPKSEQEAIQQIAFEGTTKQLREHVVSVLCKYGYQPIPIKSGEKRPLTLEWNTKEISFHDLLQFDTDTFGIRCGDHGLTAIDVDSKNHNDPGAFLERFLEKVFSIGIAQESYTVQNTPSGGVHLFFRTDTPEGNQKLAMMDGKTIIETRGVGGQCVIYDYEATGMIPSLPILQSDKVNKLIDACRSFDPDYSQPIAAQNRGSNENANALEVLLRNGWSIVDEDGEKYRVRRPNATSPSSGVVYKDSMTTYIFSTGSSLPAETSLGVNDLLKYLEGEDMPAVSFSQTETTENERVGEYFETITASALYDMNLVPPKKLLGSLWCSGETAVLFASTNVGKSVLALQIAVHLARGTSLCEELPNETKGLRVLYLDFEHSKQQLKNRFGGWHSGVNNLRFSFPQPSYKSGVSEALRSISMEIEKHCPEAVVIDNISALNPDNEGARDAHSLMMGLKKLKDLHDVSMLVIGHTPKKDPRTTIEITHLAGSAQIGNLLDSCFAIAKAAATNENHRYLKELKNRNFEYTLHENNVLLLEIQKSEERGLHFIPKGHAEEHQLLIQSTHSKADRNQEVLELHLQGFSYREIAEKTGISKSTVGDIIKKHKD
ncbi:AAA family ATPase [bacterium]|nr:AAA family ATPase [bacterium]